MLMGGARKKERLTSSPARKKCNGRTLLEEDRVPSAPLGAMRRREVQTLSQARIHPSDRDS